MDKTGRLRILHIEDDPADAELTSRALLASDLDCDIRLAMSQRDCLAILEQGGLDLILSDSRGYDFSGRDILRRVRQRMPQVPFIFLSGSFENIDPETLKAEGAADCLLKDELDKLVPAIRAALYAARTEPDA